MEGTDEILCDPENMLEMSSSKSKTKLQRARSFTDAIRDKYCNQENDVWSQFIIDMTIRGKPKDNGNSSAELGHLRNVVLNNQRVAVGGIPHQGLSSLCPNVTDLDLSSNLLQSWAEVLPILYNLPNLTFLNLSRNHITEHKEVLWKWSTPLPRLENVVLNSTGVPLREVVALASLMPALRELHICCNYYQDLGNIEAAINEGALAKLECLRLNENIITSWAEVWKLRSLPALKQLILSENPLCDVFYSSDSKEDLTMFDLDIFDNTCYSDGEDSSFGKYDATKVVPEGSYCSKAFFSEADGSVSALATSADKVALANDGVLKDRVILQNINMCSTVITDQNKTKTEGEHDLKQEVLYQQNDAASQQDESKLQLPFSILTWHPSVVYELLDEIVFSAWQHVIGEQKLHATGRLRKEPAIDWVTKDEGKTNQQETNRVKLHASGVILDVVNSSVNGRPNEEYSRDHNKCTTKLKLSPFEKLDTLCLSRTSICEVKHLQALNQFPQLKSLKIMEIALFSDVQQEDRRKLFVASLPGIKVLNGSEVTPTEREKAERHYLRHFLNNQEKALRYKELVAKHGPIQPLLDIDLGVRFQKDATLTFVLCGEKEFQETVSVLQPVGKLRTMVAERLAIPWKSFRMFHFACGPHQQEEVFDELFLDSLPLSRFDFMDGDEIHIEFIEDVGVNPVVSFSKKAIFKTGITF